MLTSPFGASIADLHGDSVGMRRHIVRQDEHRRLAVAHEIARHGEDEVGLVRYILVRNFSTISMVISGRRLTSAGPSPSCCCRRTGRASRDANRWLRQHGGDDPIGRALQQVPDEGPPMQKPSTMNLSMPR
jgi:hypothetical protein